MISWESHCVSLVESESKLSETELNRIEKNESYPCLVLIRTCRMASGEIKNSEKEQGS